MRRLAMFTIGSILKDVAELEAELASLRVRERDLAERLNATRRLIEVARAELRSRELGVKPRRGR